ncbi:MAG: DUF2177 family protein [Caulobacterales bacterium]
MSSFVISWLVAAAIILVLDGIWLTQIGPRLYRPLIGELLAPNVNITAAIAFYLIYVTGTVFLAVTPALDSGSITKALLLGAILGFVAYGTYDLTNHTTMKVWDIRVTLADMAWGVFLTASAAVGATFVTMQFR